MAEGVQLYGQFVVNGFTIDGQCVTGVAVVQAAVTGCAANAAVTDQVCGGRAELRGARVPPDAVGRQRHPWPGLRAAPRLAQPVHRWVRSALGPGRWRPVFVRCHTNMREHQYRYAYWMATGEVATPAAEAARLAYYRWSPVAPQSTHRG